MITDDEVMRLFEEADPARAIGTAPVPDAVSYLDTLRSSSVVPVSESPRSGALRSWARRVGCCRDRCRARGRRHRHQ